MQPLAPAPPLPGLCQATCDDTGTLCNEYVDRQRYCKKHRTELESSLFAYKSAFRSGRPYLRGAIVDSRTLDSLTGISDLSHAIQTTEMYFKWVDTEWTRRINHLARFYSLSEFVYPQSFSI